MMLWYKIRAAFCQKAAPVDKDTTDWLLFAEVPPR